MRREKRRGWIRRKAEGRTQKKCKMKGWLAGEGSRVEGKAEAEGYQRKWRKREEEMLWKEESRRKEDNDKRIWKRNIIARAWVESEMRVREKEAGGGSELVCKVR